MPSLPLLRLTGWAALAAGLVHLFQFLELGIGPALNEPEFPTPAEAASNYWFGLVGGTTFTLISLVYVLFFSAATALVWREATGTGVVWRRAMQSTAIIGIAGWLLAGMNNIARRGFNAAGIEQIGSDNSVARAALQSTYVFQTAAIMTMAVTFCAWWIAFIVYGIRSHTIGWSTGVVVLALGGIIPLVGWAVNLGGIPSIILAFFFLGDRGHALDRRAFARRDHRIANAFMQSLDDW